MDMIGIHIIDLDVDAILFGILFEVARYSRRNG
jgi:hypothetical protein